MMWTADEEVSPRLTYADAYLGTTPRYTSAYVSMTADEERSPQDNTATRKELVYIGLD
jgi:hypothetical protein